jgi:hypothetical protein
MRKSGLIMPEALQRQIRSSALEFATEVIEIVQRAVAGLADQFSSGKPPVAKPPAGRRPAQRAARPAPVRAPKDSAALQPSLLGLLKKNKEGMGAEAINAALGTTTKDIIKPLQDLLAQGRITRTGQARGTKYHAAG